MLWENSSVSTPDPGRTSMGMASHESKLILAPNLSFHWWQGINPVFYSLMYVCVMQEAGLFAVLLMFFGVRTQPIPLSRYVCFQLTQTTLCLSAMSQDVLLPLVLCSRHILFWQNSIWYLYYTPSLLLLSLLNQFH